MPAEDQKSCFIAMPITTHEHEATRYGGDADHWGHVMETIFVPAIQMAGFEPVRPQAVGSDMIHGHIVRALESADMVLCDLSGHNPNVFFELGVRTSLNKPVALVKDEHLGFPFDTGVLNTHSYLSSLNGWDVAQEVQRLSDHILASDSTCRGGNPMWQHFGLTMAAEKPSSGAASASEAKLELIFEGMQDLRREVNTMRDITTMTVGAASSQFGKPSSGILRDLEALAADLEPVLGGVMRHIGPVKGKDSFTLRFVLPVSSKPTRSLTDKIDEVAQAHGYSVTSITRNELGMVLTVRPV